MGVASGTFEGLCPADHESLKENSSLAVQKLDKIFRIIRLLRLIKIAKLIKNKEHLEKTLTCGLKINK